MTDDQREAARRWETAKEIAIAGRTAAPGGSRSAQCFSASPGELAAALTASEAELDMAIAAGERYARRLLNHRAEMIARTETTAAQAAGHTPAVQVDADGQHDVRDIPRLLALAAAQPQALVTGVPIYDESVPRSRLYGRYVTHFWVWVHTLSFRIRDSMCGFRVYPLEASLAIWNAGGVGRRMDFDTDILVRLHWRGAAIVELPTHVTYPLDGVSHFDLLRDNLRISWMHTRLFFGMLRRLPRLLWQRLAPPTTP